MIRDLYENDPATLRFYEKMFDDGSEPWFASCGDKIVGVIWLFRSPYLLPWEGYDAYVLNVSFEPTAILMGNALISPEIRRKKLFSVIAQHCFDAWSNGEVYSHVDEGNIPSIKTHDKLGFKRCGVAYFFRVGRKTVCFMRTRRGTRSLFRIPRGVPVSVSLISPDKPSRCKHD